VHSRRKVLHFGKFFPPPFGGIESHVYDLSKALSKHWDVSVVVASRDGRAREFKSDDVQVIELGTPIVLNATPIMPAAVFWLRNFVKRNGIDVVHVHAPNPMATLACLAVEREVPIVITWHSDIIRQKVAKVLYRPLESWLLRRASAVVATTPLHFSSSDALNRVRGVDKKFSVVPFGISLPQLDGSSPVNADDQNFTVVSVGRQVSYKGYEYLIEAMALLPERVKLRLIGTGPLHESLQSLAKTRNVSHRVAFLGSVKQQQLIAELHSADLFCLPSITQAEAFGIATAEAMLLGLPAVTCDLGNGVNYLNRHGHTGLVVPPQDAPALATAIGGLANDPHRCAVLGEQARQWIENEFSPQRMIDTTLSVYERVLGERR
jgi:glycosyltransferase involved in cell wall biosynthesis